MINNIGIKDINPNKILFKGSNKFEDIGSDKLFNIHNYEPNIYLRQIVAKTERYLDLYDIINDPKDTYYLCVSYEKIFKHKFEIGCKKCIGKELCSGYVHSHIYNKNCNKINCIININNGGSCYGYTFDHIKYNSYGNMYIKNLHKYKCNIHCKCKCNNNKCAIDNCKYQISTNDCNCVCDENCESLETQLGISESIDENDMSDFFNDYDNMIDINKTLVRGIKEELCFSCNNKDIVLYNHNYNTTIGKNNLFYNASLEMKNEVNLNSKFVNYNNQNYNDDDDDYKDLINKIDQKGNVLIKIFGNKDILIQKIENHFKNNEYYPNDSIIAMVLIHRENMIKIFPQLFTNHVLCKYAHKGCLNNNCGYSHLFPNEYNLINDNYSKKYNI